jgi:hypothetical protein
MILYRPVGLNELRLLYEADLRAFPPRLPEQPIFYPVLNEPYAIKIARDWNTKSETRAGFVTRFSVEDAYAARYERKVVGSREHEELWVPAEDLADFNRHLEGAIEVIGAFFGEGFTGEVAEEGALAGKGAREQFVALAAMVRAGGEGVDEEIRVNARSVFLGFYYWEHGDFVMEGIGAEARDLVLARIREGWARGHRAGLSLGAVHPTSRR